MTVNSTGFSASTMENVVVEIGRETTLEVALSVGPVTGTVDGAGHDNQYHPAGLLDQYQSDFH